MCPSPSKIAPTLWGYEIYNLVEASLLIFNMSKIKEGYSIRFNSIQSLYQLRALKGQQENCT